MPKLHVTTLDNGLRLIVAPSRGTATVTVHAFFGVGSRYEDEANSGISHFLEHLMFKGTPRRPTTQFLSQELDGVGAVYNAYTAKDRTTYFVRLPAEHLELGIDVVADITIHPLLEASEIERERGVIVEEMNMYDDNPMMLIDELAEEQLFQGHSLHNRILGTLNNIQKDITRGMIGAHHRTFYQPRNAVVVVAGKCQVERVVELVKKYFVFPISDGATPAASAFKPRQQKPRLVTKSRVIEQANLAIAFPSVSLKDRAAPAVHTLANLLGGTMSSRLFIEVRERLGLCYSISASHTGLADCGVFMVVAGLDRARLGEAMKVIRAILDEVTRTPPPQAEVDRAVTNLVSRMAMSLEDCSAVADWLGTRYLLTGTLQTARQRMAALKKVTPLQVQRAASRLIDWRRANVAVIGQNTRAEEVQTLIQP